MPSLAMRLVAVYLRLTQKPRMSTVERARARILSSKPISAPPPWLLERHAVVPRRMAGFVCWTITPTGNSPRSAAVYLHGGAYVSGMSPQHWALVSRLADTGVEVSVPDYGLAPQHTYREAYPFIDAVLSGISLPLTVLGDSAGAGLALGVLQARSGRSMPARLILIAPWLDLTLSNPGVAATEARDPWLSSVGLREAGRYWAGGDDPADPRLSPVNGSLTGLPPTDVYIGTRDLFHPDVLALAKRGSSEGVQLTVHECEGGVHVYPLTPTPEGRAAVTEIVHLATSPT